MASTVTATGSPGVLTRRTSGILLHPTSLPGPCGTGDIGLEARRFVDFLHSAGQSVWQMLPVGPVGYGNSPYSAHSAFAGSPMLVALDDLVPLGLLSARDLDPPPDLPPRHADYAAAAFYRESRMRAAFRGFLAARSKRSSSAGSGGDAERAMVTEHDAFCARAAPWLEEFALYSAIKHRMAGVSWLEWPAPLRTRDPAALDEARRELAPDLAYVRFQQWLFDRQWSALRRYARERGVALLGDVPIFVALDSADAWAERRCFQLDDQGRPTAVAGVPPDYFSRTGQLWGNPLYRWDHLAADGYRWWIDRMACALTRFDALRLDHFIGFVRAWAVPAGARTAAEGRYQQGPGDALFEALERSLGKLPLIAEDLGVVTAEVKALRDRHGFPGIRVLQFAFGDDPCAPDFKPHNYPRHALACTGTHDNDTTVGWFHERGGEGSTRSPEQTGSERRAALDYLGASPEASGDGSRAIEIHWRMIRALLASVANLAIIPMQDLLGLGSEARMNRPGTASGNWEWRLAPGEAAAAVAARLRHLCALYDRLPGAADGPAK